MFLGAISGFSAEVLAQPFYWIMTVSLAALAGLAMGDGIGAKTVRRAPVQAQSPAFADVGGVPA
jgi:hypothetical protein